MSDLLPVEDAIARILIDAAPLGAEEVALADAVGRRLAEPLAARRTQPPFPASSMDGYAVRATEAVAGARLKVIGVAAAGHGFEGSLGQGEAVRIFTGAPVPAAADAVLIQEDAEAGDEAITVRETVRAGQNIRPAGLDFAEGAVLLDAGRRLGMREIALASAMGYGRHVVRRQPRVAFIATGDELVPPGVMPAGDQIVASSGAGLAAFVQGLGASAQDLGIVPDDRRAIERAVETALALPADIIVTLGGASVGDHDLVRDALAAQGMDLDFWRIAMRPGKPLLFGRLTRTGGRITRVLGLPGNPVSSLVCAILFLQPLIEAFLGVPRTDPTEDAILATPLPANDRRQDYLRAGLGRAPDGRPLATPFAVQDSSMLAVLAAAGCLVVRPPLALPARAGDPCRIIRLP